MKVSRTAIVIGGLGAFTIFYGLRMRANRPQLPVAVPVSTQPQPVSVVTKREAKQIVKAAGGARSSQLSFPPSVSPGVSI